MLRRNPVEAFAAHSGIMAKCSHWDTWAKNHMSSVHTRYAYCTQNIRNACFTQDTRNARCIQGTRNACCT